MKYHGLMSKGVPLRVSPGGTPWGTPGGYPPSFKAVVLSRFKPLVNYFQCALEKLVRTTRAGAAKTT